MKLRVRYTRGVAETIDEIVDNQLVHDLASVEPTLQALRKWMDRLSEFPFSSRRAHQRDTYIREVDVMLGGINHVALFDVEPAPYADDDTAPDKTQYVTVLALRPWRDDERR